MLWPLGSGTDATHQPSPALRLLGYHNRITHVLGSGSTMWYHASSGIRSTVCRWCRIYWMKNWCLYQPSHRGWTLSGFIQLWFIITICLCVYCLDFFTSLYLIFFVYLSNCFFVLSFSTHAHNVVRHHNCHLFKMLFYVWTIFSTDILMIDFRGSQS